MGYWQWVSLAIFVIPMLFLFLVDGILYLISTRFKRANSAEFGVIRTVDGIRGRNE